MQRAPFRSRSAMLALALVALSGAANAQEQGPYAPGPPASSLPAAAPRDELPPPERNSGLGYGLVAGLGVGHLAVDLGPKHETTGVGAFLHLGGSIFSGTLSARARLSGLFGGCSGGAENAYSAEAWIGGGPTIKGMSQFFVRIGAEGYAFKNDELEASTGSIPAVQIGYQLWAEDFGFEIAPRAGMTARSEYEPGDEREGRRHWRRLGLRAGYGGGATVISKFFFLDGSMLRIADSDPLTVVDGRLCLVPLFVAVCGHGQYWRSIANLPNAPGTIDVPSFYLGAAIGIGVSGSGDEGPFRTQKPPPPPPAKN